MVLAGDIPLLIDEREGVPRGVSEHVETLPYPHPVPAEPMKNLRSFAGQTEPNPATSGDAVFPALSDPVKHPTENGQRLRASLIATLFGRRNISWKVVGVRSVSHRSSEVMAACRRFSWYSLRVPTRTHTRSSAGMVIINCRDILHLPTPRSGAISKDAGN